VTDGFATDISSRLVGVRKVLSELYPSTEERQIDRMLKWYEFRRKNPDLENKLSREFRKLTYKIASGHGDEVTWEEYEKAENEFHAAYDKKFGKIPT
jgi:hypothetical protein